MKIKLVILVLSFLIISCSSKAPDEKQIESSKINTLTDQEKVDGWELLFDGETLNGWRGIGIASIPEGHWIIEDGSIKKVASGNVPLRPDGQPLKGGDLMTDKTYNNFELSFEWKISSGGNSGVKYNVIEQVSIDRGSSNALGYEYQVLDNDNHSDNVNPTHRAASLYDMIKAKGISLKPVGEFNSAKIVFNNNHGEHWLNGKKVVEYDIDTQEFEELFQKSKYHEHPEFTKHKIAHIILQDHGDDCWYRNIKIKELK